MRITWQGEVNKTDLLEGYRAAIQIIKQNPVRQILIDQSKRQLILEEDPEPIFLKLFNEALTVISHHLFLAMVVSPEEYYLTNEMSRFGNYEKFANNYVIVERFKSRDEAEAWLETVK